MYVFDAEPLIAFLLGKPEARRLVPYLERIRSGRSQGWINLVNAAELHYKLYRRSREGADAQMAELRSWGFRYHSADSVWKKAAELKAIHAVPLADAFAIATALSVKGELFCGRDAHYDRVKDIVTIRRFT